jgi:EmrB/QacA subfamily drug resistance transporter
VVNVGLPAIGRSLGATPDGLQWAINAYLLPLSALLLLGGAVGDRFGRCDTLVFGVAIFGIGSALCAAAPNLLLLLGARALQGIGAAVLLPNSLAILGSAFSGEARGRAVGTWSAASAIFGAAGPVLGGWLIDVAGWRLIFLINIPLAVASIALALLFVEEPLSSEKKPPLDLSGAIAIASSLLLLTWGLTIGAGRTGWNFAASAEIAAGLGLLAAFLWIERRLGDAAMIPLALFKSRDFVGLSVLTLLLYGALGAMFVLVPYLLIQGAGSRATAAGAALLPLPLVLALSSPTMGAIAARVGPRIPLTIGPMVVAAGFLLFLRFTPATGYRSGILPALLVISLGMTGAVAPLTTAVLASVDSRHTASASGLNSALARVGGLVATALLGGVFSAHGGKLFAAFHFASVICAAAALGAGVAAFALVGQTARAAAH